MFQAISLMYSSMTKFQIYFNFLTNLAFRRKLRKLTTLGFGHNFQECKKQKNLLDFKSATLGVWFQCPISDEPFCFPCKIGTAMYIGSAHHKTAYWYR